MGTTPLGRFLSGLCTNTPWKYAVFWKLNHQSPLVLTWEDGYLDSTAETQNMGIKIYDNYADIASAGTHGSPIGYAVANMSTAEYAFGEGLVGEVAYTGNHMWVSVDGLFTGEFDSEFSPYWTDECFLQIASGIKTIVLVPVLPDGVIQLGSFEEVAEDLAVVGIIRDRFDAYCNLTEETIPSTLIMNQPWSSSTPIFSIPLESNNFFTFTSMKEPKSEEFEDVHDMFLAAENDTLFETSPEHVTGFPSDSFSSYFSRNNQEIVDNIMVEFSSPEELFAYSLSSSQNMEFLEKWSAEKIEAQIYDGGYDRLEIFKFPEDLELHRALGPVCFQEDHYGQLFCEVFDAEEHQLDLASCSVDPSSTSSESVPSQRKSTPFCHPQVQSKEVPEKSNFSEDAKIIEPEFVAWVESSASLNGMASTLTYEDQMVKGHGRAQSNSKIKGKKSNSKSVRMKSGSSQKARPRDRQLIQDRVKELRDLVPNGSKFSIDGLLDRTIKHMLYLKSVSEQSEKLKQHLRNENRKSSKVDAPHNGTCYAFEVGSNRQSCPIVVEDLGIQGNMLIEVLCDDHGLFLEIAQLIRRLDLTILKGTLENRSSDTWAHFVVEATKGFHRMEIFWPLLHLLQRKKSRISSRV